MKNIKLSSIILGLGVSLLTTTTACNSSLCDDAKAILGAEDASVKDCAASLEKVKDANQKTGLQEALKRCKDAPGEAAKACAKGVMMSLDMLAGKPPVLPTMPTAPAPAAPAPAAPAPAPAPAPSGGTN